LAAWAGVVATIGDFGLLWTANAQRPELGLRVPPEAVLWLGGLLGVVAIPLYVFGYRAAATRLATQAPRGARLFVIVGSAGVLVGAAIHAVTTFHLRAELVAGVPGRPPHAPFMEPGSLLGRLGMIATGLALVGWGTFARAGWSSSPSRRLMLWSPPVLTIAITVLTLPFEFGRSFLGAAAPNVSHALFFFVLAAALTRR
jgi:hypothetical protein